MANETKKPALYLAEYTTPNAIAQAAMKVRDAGYQKWDCHTPYAMHGMDEAMGLKPTRIGIVSFVFGMLGVAIAWFMMQYTNGFAFNLPYFSEFHSLTSYTTVVDSLAIFIDDPLLFEPDTSFSYSTYGYTLASAALEAAAKADFQSLLETEVTEPANMTHTRLDRDPYLPDRVSSYPVNPFNKREVVYLGEPDVSNKWAGGGLVSTADDLTRFAAALLGDDLVEATWREELFAPRLLPDGNENPQHYGLGFRINRRSKESAAGNLYRAVHHGGTALGSQAFLVMLPAISLSVAVVINVNAGGSSLMLGRVTELLDLFVPLAEQRVAGPL